MPRKTRPAHRRRLCEDQRRAKGTALGDSAWGGTGTRRPNARVDVALAATVPVTITSTAPARRTPVLILVCVAQFVDVLGVTVVVVALEHVQRDLTVGEAALSWVVSLYARSA